MNKSKLGWSIHFSSYYLCWIACFYFAAQDAMFLGPIIGLFFIAVQIAWQLINRLPCLNAVYFALFIGLIGAITDTIWLHAGYIYFKANPFTFYFAAPWVICIWLSFGLNLVILNEKLMHHYLICFLFALFFDSFRLSNSCSMYYCHYPPKLSFLFCRRHNLGIMFTQLFLYL